jgi:diguanylate cyclase (GGDEF)-like protein
VIDNHDQYSVSLVWNTLSTIGIFLVISLLVHKVRIMWESERQHSRRDFLTGFLNTRAFQEIMEYEINRLSRAGKPLTIAYIDLDNFKVINDTFGHIRGDELLKCFASSLVGRLRKTDLVARIGGDEFVILLPETDQEAAKVALHKIKDSLLHDMKKDHWSTTFSMGVVTCREPPLDSEELIIMADEMMYKVKQDGKNSIRFCVYPPANEV